MWILPVIVLAFVELLPFSRGANLAIRIPGDVSQRDGFYRLDYWPPQGLPPPNTTFKASDISNTIEFRQGLPGTRYEFRLFFSNGTIGDWLTWTAGITTAPDPPTDVQIKVRGGKLAGVSWNPPFQGGFSGYKIKIYPLSEASSSVRTLVLADDASPFNLRELTPGGSYKIELHTLFENKESINFITRNFTTRPNTPGRFIVWFRNETTLLVLWQPPYPPGVYSNYKVSIEPPDAIESTLDVEKVGEPPGPAQAAFYGLLPGRAYNISVQTVSNSEISQPTTAQYRTVPQRPRNVTFDKRLIKSDSFEVRWEEPKGPSEFDRYHVSIGTGRQQPIIVVRDDPRVAEFSDGLEPGRTYQVLVKSLSGNVASWPGSGNVTTKPRPVLNLNTSISEENGDLIISWRPDPNSFQESFKVSYEELETPSGDSSTFNVLENQIVLDTLLPGRNYSITVTAASNGVESVDRSLFQATRPSPPIIEASTPIPGGMNISWKSDVNSKQDEFAVVYARNDTGEMVTIHVDMPRIALQSLFPGAGYDIKVFAISHGLWSEPHVYFQAVYPNPPRNATIQKASNSSITLTWVPPFSSLFTNYIIKYHIAEKSSPTERTITNSTAAELVNLIPGERYIFSVNTKSFLVESPSPQILEYTLRPNPIPRLIPILDSTNITLEWTRPFGRIDTYRLFWYEKHSPVAPNRRLKEIEGSATSASIEDLTPGELYTFELISIAHDVPSQKVTVDTRTMPLITSYITIGNNREEHSLTVVYTATPSTVSKFDSYRFLLSDPAIPSKEKAADDAERKVVFEDLVPGRLYNITLWTVSGGVTSKPLHRQDRLYPEPITTITATSVEDTDISISWDIPPGDYDAFEVQYNDDRLYQSITANNSITFLDLKPHKNYTFTVIVRSGTDYAVLRKSVPVSESFTTLESTPGKVTSFRPVDVQPREIKFEWALPPIDQNGILTGYTITYGLKGLTNTYSRDFEPGEGFGVITNLYPGKTYVFKMQAKTKVGYGNATKWEETMPIGAPPRPLMSHYPVEVAKTTETIQIKFEKKFFSDINGEVQHYAIIVAEDESKDSSRLDLPKWRDVQSFSLWPPYQVSEPFMAFQHSHFENYTIGTEVCQGKSGFCNGPLKPGTIYRIKIRAFTFKDKFTDTVYSQPMRTESNNTAVVLSVIIPLMLLVILGVMVVMVRQRRCPYYCLGRNKGMRHADGLSMADSIIPTTRPVKLKDFSEHYRIMSADSDFRFSVEYEELKNVGRDQTCIAADLPCNRPKNRFTNILPYDHSRFKLQPTDDEEGSDYINSNYVPGFNSPREFVVTQGPLHSTRDDFWRMCWESGARAIVMLTRCVEKGREKCDRYWPYDMQPVSYGDIQVVVLNESHYPDWSVCEFRMSRGDISRVIRHFHFTTWPDFGVPEPPTTLVRFVRTFRDRVGPESKPVVVHCSAGVGRSGTFIALDRVIQHMRVNDYVDIYGIVYEMRRERVWMVQTEQQYVCIYQCILSVLEGRISDQEPLPQPLSPRELHDNQGYEDDEGIAESGM